MVIRKPDLYNAGAVPYQLSYQVNWELVVMWVDYKPVDYGYRSIYLILIHEVHVSELQIKINMYA